MECDYLIVGAGIYGLVVAERIANDLGKSVLVVEKREHIGGNCFSETDAQTGIEYHVYGTHIFHTDNSKVWSYLRRFTELNGYHHQVLTKHNGTVYQMPINLETINTFYGTQFGPQEARIFIQGEIAKETISTASNFEESAILSIGRPLYEAFIKGYTKKQWGKDPRDLPSSILSRLPIRYDYREDYFHNCRWQGIPIGGYTQALKKLLKSDTITLQLNCDYHKHRDAFQVKEKTIYTGMLDEFFEFRYGKFDWRSVSLEKRYVDDRDFQGTSVMNYADEDIPYTRIHEPRHLHTERDYPEDRTVIFLETSNDAANTNPYYPVHDVTNQKLKAAYQKDAEQLADVIFGGRLGEYEYYDMDRAILSALECYESSIRGN